MTKHDTIPGAPKFDYFLAVRYSAAEFPVDVAERILEQDSPREYVALRETCMGTEFLADGKYARRMVYITQGDEILAVTAIRAVLMDVLNEEGGC